MPKGDYDGISEQSRASGQRLADARALLDADRWRGSMYMAGYAVECLLKTKLMKMFDCRNLKELELGLKDRGIMATRDTIFTNQLEVLLRWCDGTERLRQDRALWRSFNLSNRWITGWCYSPDQADRDEAEAFLEATEDILKWAESNL